MFPPVRLAPNQREDNPLTLQFAGGKATFIAQTFLRSLSQQALIRTNNNKTGYVC